MYSNFRVVVLIPGGRRAYMRALMPHLLAQPSIDEIRILVNTENATDIAYMEALKSEKTTLQYLPKGVSPSGNKTVNLIYRSAIEKDTVYIKIDDDIVWMEDGTFENLLSKRFKYRDAFFISPIVINNSHCTHILQRNRKIDFIERYVGAVAGGFAWKEGKVAVNLHNHLLSLIEKNKVSELHVEDQFVASTRFSINCICFFGEKMAALKGEIPDIWRFNNDDEEYLSVHAPGRLGTYNVVCGDAVVAHHSFYTQAIHVNRSDILSRYQALATKKSSSPPMRECLEPTGGSVSGVEDGKKSSVGKFRQLFSSKSTEERSSHYPLMLVSFPQQGTDFFCDELAKCEEIEYSREYFNPLCNPPREKDLRPWFGDERKELENNIFRRLTTAEYDKVVAETWSQDNFNTTKENYSPANIANHARYFHLASIFRHRSLTVPTTYPHLSHATYNSFLNNAPIFDGLKKLHRDFQKRKLDSSQREALGHLVNWYSIFKTFSEDINGKNQKFVPVIDYTDLLLMTGPELEKLFLDSLPISRKSAKELSKNIRARRFGGDKAKEWVRRRVSIYNSCDVEDFYQDTLSNYILAEDPDIVKNPYFSLLK